jgi:hypothetical protein
MKQKTALEQFAIALYEGGYLQGNGDEIQELLEQHLEVGKKQLIEAYHQGVADEYGDALEFGDVTDGEAYYNETYGDNK